MHEDLLKRLVVMPESPQIVGWHRTAIRDAATAIRELIAENATLAAGACTEGARGLLGDDHDNSYCAMKREVERLQAENARKDEVANKLVEALMVQTVRIGRKTYKRIIPYPKTVNDDTCRCITCGQIDEPDWHDDVICGAVRSAIFAQTSALGEPK